MGSTKRTHPKSVAPGIRFIIERNRRAQRLITDSALGVAIIALFPLDGTLILELKILLTAVIIWKMMRDIRHLWGRPKWQRALALASNLLGGLGALSTALLAWLTLFCLSLLFPPARMFTLAAALFTLTWSVGKITNQFYLSSLTSTIDRSALKRAFKQMPQRRLF